MRLLLALSIALGTANLLVVPTETGLDRMTRTADRTHEQVASAPRTRSAPRRARTTTPFDRTPAVSPGAVRDSATSVAMLPTGFTMRVIADSSTSAVDDITTADAAATVIAR